MAATDVPSVIVNLKVLSQDNYEDWSFRVKTYLLAEDLWKVVEVREPPKEGQADFNAWSKDNAKALHAIHISCGDNAYAFIRGKSMAKDAWEILAKKFNPTEESHNADPEIEAVEGGESMRGNSIYEAFLENLDHWNWAAVMEFIRIHPEAVRAKHPSYGMTALHIAVIVEEVDIAKELVHLVTMEDLEIKDNSGYTALARAALGNTDKKIEIAKCLVEKNKNLLTIVNSKDNIPLVSAFTLQNWKMVTYMYSVTPVEALNDRQAAQLISLGFVHKCFDIPLDLIRHNPSLGITEDGSGRSPLFQLADTRSAFLSGSGLRFWEKWIYHCIHVEPAPTKGFKKEATTNINDDVCIDVRTPERSQGNQRHLNICNAVGQFFQELVVTNLLKLVGINRLYQVKLFHVRSLEILQCICEVLETKYLKDMQDDDILVSAIFRAVQLGKVEFITHIYKANSWVKFVTNVHDQTLFQFAAECRQEKIYNLIYGFDEEKQKDILGIQDKFGNNMLHIIGISSFAQINHIQGAALQMQRELQWFKEVERTIRPHEREEINRDHITPRELFTKNHRELLKEGEKWMKEATTAYIIAGALIVTIMFAAIFTVPGGNDEHTGFPKFLDRRAFKIFIASDAIALFFSTTSVMIFLGIPTSRYAEDDFLKSLPTKLILGIFTLFVSIAAMMITFSSTLFLMAPGESWIAFPAILLSTVPIASFVWIQFPLLVEIIISTYGAGPFDKKVKPWDKKL